ncbi:dual specificity protein kinase kns1 [Boothiomyces sp. JEL0866]|nr:dual specificity protein kinase kns1 [Boothiomyces sp. JEL0866]
MEGKGSLITTIVSQEEVPGRRGTFGKVVEAYDNQTNTRCAIKIIKSVQKYIDASKIEIRVLKRILERDPKGTK